jgi:hypothetical protein
MRAEDGTIIISDTTLWKLLPIELRPARETHKQLCGCKLCNTVTSLHKTLNAFCLRTLKQLTQSVNRTVLPRQRLASLHQACQDYRHSVANPNNTLKYLKPSDVLTVMTCPNVADTQFPLWKCVLGNCLDCPKYQIASYKEDMTINTPRINFVTYERQSCCTIHGPCGLGIYECNYCLVENNGTETDEENSPISKGKKAKIVNKKFPTLRCSKIGSFIHLVYLPVLDKCRYHFCP